MNASVGQRDLSFRAAAAHSLFSATSQTAGALPNGQAAPAADNKRATPSYSSAKYTIAETQAATHDQSFASHSPQYSHPRADLASEQASPFSGQQPGRQGGASVTPSEDKPSATRSTAYDSAFQASRLPTAGTRFDADPRNLLQSEAAQPRRVTNASSRHAALTTLGSVPGLGGSAVAGRVLGPSRLVSERAGEARLVDVRAHADRVLEERVFEGETRVVGERELKRERKSETRQTSRQEITVDRVQRAKIVEVIRENAVPYEEFVDVLYDVVIDVPIERLIEREIITETLLEIPIEKTVETVVEQLIEVPVERVVEVPTQVKRFVEVPVERVVARPYDSVRENVVYTERVIDIDEKDLGAYPGAQVLPTAVSVQHLSRVEERPVYVENVVERRVEVPRPRVVEIPVDRVVERRVPVLVERGVPVERQVFRDVDVAVVNEVRQVKEIVVERPVYRENVIEQRVPRERLVEREVLVPVEHVVEVPRLVENRVEKPYDVLVEVPVPREQLVELPRQQLHEVGLPVERVLPRSVEKVLHRRTPHVTQTARPFDVLKQHSVARPAERSVERRVNRFVEVPVERVVERPMYMERVVERPVFVERTVSVPMERVSERVTTVERLVERPVTVDTVVEVLVEHIVVRDVHVPVEKVIEVPISIGIERPVYRERLVEEEVVVELLNEQVQEEFTREEYFEHEDEFLAGKVRERELELNAQMRKNNELRDTYLRARGEWEAFMAGGSAAEERDNLLLHARVADLAEEIKCYVTENHVLRQRSMSRSTVVNTQLQKDPRVELLKSRLHNLLGENHHLVNQAMQAGERVKNICAKF